MPLGEGSPPQTRGERRAPLQKCYFASIGSSSMKMVAHKHRHAA